MTEIRGVWASPEAREVFSVAEMNWAVEDYSERGLQHFAMDSGFAFYQFGGRVLVLGERRGLVSLFTKREIEAELGRPLSDSYPRGPPA
jgi:hypothetical protein